MLLFVISEGIKNIFRSKFTGILTIFSMICSLLFLSFLGILLQTVHLNLTMLKNRTTVWVYFPTSMETSLSKEYLEKMEKIKGVRLVRFISKREGLHSYYEKNSDQSDKDVLGMLGYNPLPDIAVFEIKDTNLTTEKIKKTREKMESVLKKLEVQLQTEMFQKVEKIMSLALKIAFIFSCFIAIVTIILVYNTIRLSIHSKKKLIRTMQLVGASNFAVKSPFIVESMLQAIISLCTVIIISFYLVHYFQDKNIGLLASILVTPIQMHPYHVVGLCGIAFFMSFFGAWVSVQKYLK